MGELSLDVKDRRILSAIELDGRFFVSDVAKAVGLSKEVVAYRLKVLGEKGIITGYHAVVNLSCLGRTVFHVAINLMDATQEDTDAILAFLDSQPEVIAVEEADVVWDILFRMAARDNRSFLAFMDAFKERFKKFIEASQVSIIIEEETLPRRYLLPQKGDAVFATLLLPPACHVDLDATDLAILKALVDDARTPLLEMARRLKLDSMTVKRRIERLEKEGVIAGYATGIDLKGLGITAFSLRLTLSDTRRLKALSEYVRHLPETRLRRRDIGGYDVSFDVDVPSQVRLESLIAELKRQFPVVRETEHFTTLRIRKRKMDGILVLQPKIQDRALQR